MNFRSFIKFNFILVPVLIAILLILIVPNHSEAQGAYGSLGYDLGRNDYWDDWDDHAYHGGGFGRRYGSHLYHPGYPYSGDYYGHRYPHDPYYRHNRHYRPFSFYNEPYGFFEPDFDRDSVHGYSGVIPYIRKDRKLDKAEQQTGPYGRTVLSGWVYLKHGEYNKAQEAFGLEVEANPQSGLPKLGYALSTALAGNLERGVWAMHQAFRYNPEALIYFPFNNQIVSKIEVLIDLYSKYKPKGDSHFLLATLHYLLNDKEQAKKHLNKSDEASGPNESRSNLRKLLEEN